MDLIEAVGVACKGLEAVFKKALGWSGEGRKGEEAAGR